MEFCSVGEQQSFLCDQSGTDIIQGAYGNAEEAAVVCESKPEENKNILEDASLMDKTDDPVVLHSSLLRSLVEDDKHLGNNEGFFF